MVRIEVGCEHSDAPPGEVPTTPSAATASRCLIERTECGLRGAGKLDMRAHARWETTLRKAARRDGDVHLDLAEVSFFDTRATTLLVQACNMLASSWRLVVHHAPAGLRRILEVLWPTGAAMLAIEENPR